MYIYIYFHRNRYCNNVRLCDYFPELLKTHFFILQILQSHFGSFFCAKENGWYKILHAY